MSPTDLALHLLGFAAPAFFVALAVTFGARFVGAAPRPLAWWAHAAINFTAGLGVLLGGLWFFGVDGKMATYAGVVFAIAAVQWLFGRAWK